MSIHDQDDEQTMANFARVVFNKAGVSHQVADLSSTPSARFSQGGELQEQLERLMAIVATVRLSKVQEYGTSRYDVSEPNYDLAMVYSDVERKLIRLKHQIFTLGASRAGEQLVDSAVDLAAYAMMLLQIVYLHWGRGNLPAQGRQVESINKALDRLFGIAQGESDE